MSPNPSEVIVVVIMGSCVMGTEEGLDVDMILIEQLKCRHAMKPMVDHTVSMNPCMMWRTVLVLVH